METLFGLVDALAAGLASLIPYPPLQGGEYRFLNRALLGLLILAPLCSGIGIIVVNHRLSFFSEAIGHSAFAGVALGYLFLLVDSPADSVAHALVVKGAMVLFAVIVAVGITAYRRATSLPSDAIIGVFSSTVVAAGLCAITYMLRMGQVRGQIFQDFLIGNILTLTPAQLVILIGFFLATVVILFLSFNRLVFIALNAELAETRGIPVAFYEYLFAVLLALVVMFAIQAVGVLLVTAMLVIPASAARNFAHSAGASFWIASLVALASGLCGLILSDWLGTATGASTILCMSFVFALSALYGRAFGK